MTYCKICARRLDDPEDLTTRDCGGDCLRCMAEVAGDPDCIEAMKRLGAMPICHCLDCGKELDRVTHPTDPAARPEPGDISICLSCGHVMAFAEDFTVRALTGKEMVEIAGDPRIMAIQKARAKVMK